MKASHQIRMLFSYGLIIIVHKNAKCVFGGGG